jgi:enterobactin synthetase component F
VLAILDTFPFDEESVETGEDEAREKEFLFGAIDAKVGNTLETLRRDGNTLEEHRYLAIRQALSTMKAFVPQRFGGDILLFVATQDRTDQPIAAWRPYVDGRIDVHRIDCTHETMMDPLPVAKIGGVLAAELDRRQIRPARAGNPGSSRAGSGRTVLSRKN